MKLIDKLKIASKCKSEAELEEQMAKWKLEESEEFTPDNQPLLYGGLLFTIAPALMGYFDNKGWYFGCAWGGMLLGIWALTSCTQREYHDAMKDRENKC